MIAAMMSLPSSAAQGRSCAGNYGHVVASVTANLSDPPSLMAPTFYHARTRFGSWAWWHAATLRPLDGAYMQDPLTRAYRYRKVAVEFSNLAKHTSSDFSRGYYQRIAEQYQMLADGELGWRQSDAVISEEKPTSSAKVWAYREQSGNKYFEVFLNDGTRARIDFLAGLTTQQSFVALGRALNDKLGSCSIIAMNDLVLFDESDGISEDQKRKLFKTLGNPLDGEKALNAISCVSGG